MIKKPVPRPNITELKESLRNNIGRGIASFVQDVHYKLPSDKKQRKELSDFFEEWVDNHEDSGRVIPKRYE
jgi:hypothetical protein